MKREKFFNKNSYKHWLALVLVLVLLVPGIPRIADTTWHDIFQPRQQTGNPLDINKLVEDINNGRYGLGLGTLTVSNDLIHSAHDKVDDMVAKRYYQHTSPEGKKSSDFIYKYTSRTKTVAEIQSMIPPYGASTATNVYLGWMQSPTHHDVIVDPNYKYIGCYGDTYGEYQYEFGLISQKSIVVVCHLSYL